MGCRLTQVLGLVLQVCDRFGSMREFNAIGQTRSCWHDVTGMKTNVILMFLEYCRVPLMSCAINAIGTTMMLDNKSCPLNLINGCIMTLNLLVISLDFRHR
jgi:hypothetical protein